MSGQVQSGGVDINVVSDTNVASDSGVEHAAILTAFADAVVKGSQSDITEAREAIISALGFSAVVDAAGVIGNFQRMNRISDGMGLELDSLMHTLSSELGESLELRKFASAANTKGSGLMKKMLGKLIYPLAVRFYRPPAPRK